ncbi:MAG: response regulator, partial [Rhizobacter sp.]
TLTRQLLAFSRRQRLEPQAVDFNEIVLGMRDLLQTTIGGSVHLQNELAEGLWHAMVDPTQLELIILNLAINARDAMEVGGSLRVRTANVTLQHPPARPEEPEPGDYVSLSVIDTGTGMTAEVLDKAFEPFFTTKEVGKGSGLGLAQAYGFAKQSGGGVRIDTRPGQGTSVHVFMPRARPGAQPASVPLHCAEPEPTPYGRAKAGPSVLVVDDDHAVREATTSLLQLHGFRVTETADGAAALALAAQRDDFELVVADFAMPRMNGAELARGLHKLRPRLPVVFMTGYSDLGALEDVPEEYVLQKPIDDSELVARL